MAIEGENLRKGSYEDESENATKLSTTSLGLEPDDGEELHDNDASD